MPLIVSIFQGWYIVTYALAIYHLNLLLAFLTPKIDPAMAEFEAEEDGPGLPTSQNEENQHTRKTEHGTMASGTRLFHAPVTEKQKVDKMSLSIA